MIWVIFILTYTFGGAITAFQLFPDAEIFIETPPVLKLLSAVCLGPLWWVFLIITKLHMEW